MKKIVLTLAVILGLGCFQLNAQTTVSGGIKAQLNLSNFLISDINASKSTMGFGPTLGGFMKVEFNENFALQPELLFHFKTSETKLEGAKNDYEYWGMEIPVYAVGQMKLGEGKGYIGVGPYVGFGFDAKWSKGNNNNLYKEYDGRKSFMSRWDFGVGAIVGYEMDNGVSVNAGYQIGLIDVLEANKDNASMRTQTVSLGVGYKF
ncbi:PorT family protein [Bacteroidales bacterium OttesenSCG-928-M06]|nr:PorT family protein [Bacteroidales bacterium OttesenSCG-928-M06]